MEIRVKNLNKKIGHLPILKNINLNFEDEGINVIIGPNGAGKTTLLKIIGLLDNPFSGEIYYDGKSSKNLTWKDRLNYRRRFGFVFQNPIVLEGNVYQNIVYGLKLRKLRINKDEVKEIIFHVGLSDKINQKAKTLSGGEKQRLQLAMVLVMKPDLFIFDEPTANLDSLMTKKIEEIIFSMSKKTIILSTHNLIQARYLGKRIYFLRNGELITAGSREEILKHPFIHNQEYWLNGKQDTNFIID